jgi:arylsulfatase A-like enzyme
MDFYTPTSCVDLLPTLLHATGQPVPDWTEGTILPGFSGSEGSPDLTVWTVEAKTNPKNAPLTKTSVSMVKENFKLVGYYGYEPQQRDYELFDIVGDPEERVDLFASRSTLAAEMRHEMEAKLTAVNQPLMPG